MTSKYVLEKIRNYKFTIVLFLFLAILPFFIRIVSLEKGYFSSVIFALLNALSLIILGILISKTKIRKVLVGVLAFVISFDFVYFLFFKSFLTVGIFASIVETSKDEASEVLSFSMLSVGVAVYAITCYLLYQSCKEVSKIKKVKVWHCLTTLLGIVFVLPFVLSYGIGQNEEDSEKPLFNIKTMSFLLSASNISCKYPLVLGDFFVMSEYLENCYFVYKVSNTQRDFPAGVILDKEMQLNAPQKILLVIGESSLNTHYSLYGYPVKTTPFLDSLSLDKSHMFHYSEVISPASFTIEAIARSLTFATPCNFIPFSNEKNIIEMAKAAGYETYWMSNQEQYGSKNNYVTSIAKTANRQYFDTSEERDDLVLAEKVREQMKQTEAKQFIVVHLRGSHISYESRFDDADTKQLGSSGTFNQYDKSIHHTDRVLKRLYESMQDMPNSSLLFYYSDHGEIINVGHGILNGGSVQYKIPLVVMTNNYDNTSLDALFRSYYNPQIKKLNSSCTSFIMSEIMGYKIDSSRKKEAINHSKFVLQTDYKTYLFDELK